MIASLAHTSIVIPVRSASALIASYNGVSMRMSLVFRFVVRLAKNASLSFVQWNMGYPVQLVNHFLWYPNSFPTVLLTTGGSTRNLVNLTSKGGEMARRSRPKDDRPRPKTTGVRIPEDLKRAARHAAIDSGQTFREWVEDAFREKLRKS